MILDPETTARNTALAQAIMCLLWALFVQAYSDAEREWQEIERRTSKQKRNKE